METDEPAENRSGNAQDPAVGAVVSEEGQGTSTLGTDARDTNNTQGSSNQVVDVGTGNLTSPPMDVVEDQQAEVAVGSVAAGGESAENAANGQNEEASNIEEVVWRLNNEVHALINEMQEVNNMEELFDDDIEEFYGFPENDANAVQPNNDDGAANVVENAEVDDEEASNSPTNSTTDSNMSLADTDSEGVEQRPAGRWLIPQHHVNEAIGELISQARRSEGGIAALLDRENFMQRVRSMIFSLDRTRLRRSLQSGNGEGQGDNPNRFDAVGGEQNIGVMEAEPVDEVMQSQSVNDNVVENESTVRFDTNLPAEHSYFGPNLNRVPGVNYLDVGGSFRMLIFMHQHLLFPGEVLPFMINGSIIEEEEENGAWSGREGIIFGIVFPFLQELGGNPLKLYGVTCQIYERGEGGREMVFFKSRALQRFVADCNDLHGPPQYIATNPKVKCYGVAKILPEVYLPEPLNCVNMGNMNRFRDESAMRDKFKRFQSASTPWPTHVYNEYSISGIVEKAREKLEKHKIDTMPTCPTQLSFWLVRNLHLTEKLMHTVFMTDSVNVRLKMIGRTFKGDSLFFCRYCNNSIAQCHELFAMSKHGVQTQYCNSAGYIHETNTVYRLLPDSVTYSGESSTEFSWFPGYKWRIIVCKFCTQHIGWEYKAIEPNLVPKVFFGLAGSSVRISKANSETSNNMRPFVYRNLLRLVSRQME